MLTKKLFDDFQSLPSVGSPKPTTSPPQPDAEDPPEHQTRTRSNTFKDSFELELFHVPIVRTPGAIRPGHWFTDTFSARDITIIAWWTLRGIEAAAAKLQHVWFHESNVTKFAYFTLPVQKNDTTGQCVSRGHPCLCRTGEPNPLCPYHALQRHTKRLHYIFQHYQTEKLPFIPTDDGQFASKSDIMKIFSSAIALTGTPLTRPGPHGDDSDTPWKPYN